MLTAHPFPNEKLSSPDFVTEGLEVWVKRLDLVHPEIPGNKFFKLKYNLQKAVELGHKQILTFGGAYSNHIHATAQAAQSLGMNSIGMIRGEFTPPLNPTLQSASDAGMKLIYLNRSTYRQKTDPDFLAKLSKQIGEFYLLPEGGTNELAIQGTQEILGREDKQFTHLACAIGTGGTFTGIATSKSDDQELIGISSLKGTFIIEEVKNLILETNSALPPRINIDTGFHFGGYAKTTPELIDFIWDFYARFGIPLDPIYTGKMAFAAFQKIKSGYFPAGSKILLIHTGGLQGNQGFTERTQIKLPPSA